MNWIKLKSIFFVLFINILVLGSLLGILEISSRFVYPEFSRHIHSDKLTMGKNSHFADFYGFNVRSTTGENYIKVDPEKEVVLVFGDSISNGYGHAFYDIWWEKLQELLDIRGLNYEFISLSGFGNNFSDNMEDALYLIENDLLKNTKTKKVVYQFNFNDISPFRGVNLKESVRTQSLWFEFSKWRYEHLNKSVFFRVAQHYVGVLRRKRSGDCVERGFDALGPYTWTYGSQFVSSESELLWQRFENNISSLSEILERKGIQFEIVVAPILYQIDKDRIHPHNFHLNLDFSCGTIEPFERLKKITLNSNIVLYDPSSYLRDKFESRIHDGNFERFFFAADDNHFTPIASGYLAQFVAKHWPDNVSE